jgi:hypothetical protein
MKIRKKKWGKTERDIFFIKCGGFLFYGKRKLDLLFISSHMKWNIIKIKKTKEKKKERREEFVLFVDVVVYPYAQVERSGLTSFLSVVAWARRFRHFGSSPSLPTGRCSGRQHDTGEEWLLRTLSSRLCVQFVFWTRSTWLCLDPDLLPEVPAYS